MKTNRRFILGVLSSLLFSIGFTQAAASIDPVLEASTESASTRPLDSASMTLPGDGICNMIDDGR